MATLDPRKRDEENRSVQNRTERRIHSQVRVTRTVYSEEGGFSTATLHAVARRFLSHGLFTPELIELTPDHGRHQRVADSDRGGQPVATAIKDMGVIPIVCFGHLNRRHGVTEAYVPELADYAISVEAGHTARPGTDIIDQHDEGRICTGPTLQRHAVELAICLEVPHPGRFPPGIGNFKSEPFTAVHHDCRQSEQAVFLNAEQRVAGW